MIVYFDYETTATTNNCLNPEQRETFLISYLMIVAFQPGLKLNRIIIECSFGHSFEKLTTIDYLTEKQMGFVDVTVAKQLRDAAERVSQRKCEKSLLKCFL